MTPSPVRLIPYQQEGEPRRQAAIVRGEPSLEGLDEGELQVLGPLMQAANLMNPIFRHQIDGRAESLQRLLLQLIEVAEGPTQQALEDYRAILELQNGPYASIPPKNHLLQLPHGRQAGQAGYNSAPTWSSRPSPPTGSSPRHPGQLFPSTWSALTSLLHGRAIYGSVGTM